MNRDPRLSPPPPPHVVIDTGQDDYARPLIGPGVVGPREVAAFLGPPSSFTPLATVTNA